MIGETLGHFRLLEKLGAGGMGEVYRARDERLGREVALKVLPPEAAGDEVARARLLHEARTASALNHPHICTVFEVGEEGGQVYLAMEWVQGQTLEERIPPGGLPPETVAQWGAQIADALAHAHGHGIVHRDLKCANVVVAEDGRAKVLDFGIARRVPASREGAARSDDPTLTATGAVVGTPGSLPPEVLRGRKADARGDIWALGVVLHQMAGGRPPFERGTPFEIAAAVLGEAPDPLPASVPPGLRVVVGRCLEKAPDRRYRSAAEARAALEASLLAGRSPSARRPARRGVGLNIAAGAAALAALAAVALFATGRWRSAPPPVAGPITIAVLPMRSLSPDPSQAYLADGLTDEIITALTKVTALRVIARSSVVAYQGTEKPARQVAKELGVGVLVLGSVLGSGGRVRLNVRLTDAVTEQNLWAESYDRDLSDILSVHFELARAVAEAVHVKLTAEEGRPAQERKVNPEAYTEYLKGRLAWEKANQPAFREALAHFERSLELDPRHAPAYVGIAECYWGMSGATLDPKVALPRIEAAARKALELDSTLAGAHAILGFAATSFRFAWEESEARFRRALELDPSNARAHLWYSFLLRGLGRYEEDVAQIREARKLDPLSGFVAAQEGWAEYFARHYRDAIRLFRQNLAAAPQQLQSRIGFALSHEQLGEVDVAIRELEVVRNTEPTVLGIPALLAHAYALAGRRADAQRLLDWMASRADSAYLDPVDLTLVQLSLGRKELALDLLERGYDDGSEWVPFVGVDPRFDPLRSEPRFERLLQKMGLRE